MKNQELINLQNQLNDIESKTIKTIKIPTMRYLSIHGHGDYQATSVFQDRIAPIFMVSGAIANKLGIDFRSPLESAWFETESEFELDFSPNGTDNLHFKILVMIPDEFTNEIVKETVEQMSSLNEYIKDIFVETINESEAMQIVHRGSFETYNNNANLLLKQIKNDSKKLSNYFHEVYMSSPQTVGTQDMVIILRYAIK